MFEEQIQKDTKRALEFFLARFWVQKKRLMEFFE